MPPAPVPSCARTTSGPKRPPTDSAWSPHQEWSWWAIRGQLIDLPGYVANCALSTIMAAAVRERLAALRGPWIEGDPAGPIHVRPVVRGGGVTDTGGAVRCLPRRAAHGRTVARRPAPSPVVADRWCRPDARRTRPRTRRLGGNATCFAPVGYRTLTASTPPDHESSSGRRRLLLGLCRGPPPRAPRRFRCPGGDDQPGRRRCGRRPARRRRPALEATTSLRRPPGGPATVPQTGMTTSASTAIARKSRLR